MFHTSKSNPLFKTPSHLVVTAPARVNLIGEHTDYNLGLALPMSINFKIIFYFRRTQGSVIRVHSALKKETFVFLDKKRPSGGWNLYVYGALLLLQQHRGTELKGFDCYFESDIPEGAGLSSSAALVCGLIYGHEQLYELGLTKLKIVQLAVMAEQHFAGTLCGILDPYACIFGTQNGPILLDCKKQQHQHIAFNLNDYQLLLIQSGVKHQLAESGYNKKREACSRAVSILKKSGYVLDSLSDFNRDALFQARDLLEKNGLFNECLYIVEENERVLLAAEALEAGNISELGSLFLASHHGMKELYRISCPEIDFLVKTSAKIKGVAGARMTGGGFGGSVLVLVKKQEAASYCMELIQKYESEFSYRLNPCVISPAAGIASFSEFKPKEDLF